MQSLEHCIPFLYLLSRTYKDLTNLKTVSLLSTKSVDPGCPYPTPGLPTRRLKQDYEARNHAILQLHCDQFEQKLANALLIHTTKSDLQKATHTHDP